ncbi:hypothetical protein QBC33DRAFT_339506 [Phialemonium atrogriseum]|uniref:Uncharacterized protein n=1 Tax=Phialemonium atrogriseum TaxID=1093897 RepID=A0AAJ0FNJ1_9PEZI|nr:uncharacterized protein QBC33DRAFT_339506 [Phialemonium atrogriseum]KAK1769049.1 hypothetical protein QBC33DRAFT_339506 [Phialemonium atrogriseum]
MSLKSLVFLVTLASGGRQVDAQARQMWKKRKSEKGRSERKGLRSRHYVTSRAKQPTIKRGKKTWNPMPPTKIGAVSCQISDTRSGASRGSVCLPRPHDLFTRAREELWPPLDGSFDCWDDPRMSGVPGIFLYRHEDPLPACLPACLPASEICTLRSRLGLVRDVDAPSLRGEYGSIVRLERGLDSTRRFSLRRRFYHCFFFSALCRGKRGGLSEYAGRPLGYPLVWLATTFNPLDSVVRCPLSFQPQCLVCGISDTSFFFFLPSESKSFWLPPALGRLAWPIRRRWFVSIGSRIASILRGRDMHTETPNIKKGSQPPPHQRSLRRYVTV